MKCNEEEEYPCGGAQRKGGWCKPWAAQGEGSFGAGALNHCLVGASVLPTLRVLRARIFREFRWYHGSSSLRPNWDEGFFIC